MRQSLTESQQCQQYYAEAVQFYINRELPAAIARNTKFHVNQRSDSFDWVVSLVSTFAKRLVKSEEVVGPATETYESSDVSFVTFVPKRPVDYLIKFIACYIPWFNRFYWQAPEKHTVPMAVKKITNTVHNHYHLLPMEGQGHEMRYHLMSWDGEYYDGSPTEWGDLKAIRDFLENEGVAYHDLMWAAKLRKLFMQYQANKQSMAITSDRSKFNG